MIRKYIKWGVGKAKEICYTRADETGQTQQLKTYKNNCSFIC